MIRDFYDTLPEARGIELRRLNKERLAALDRDSKARQARIALAVERLSEVSRRPGAQKFK